MLLLLQVNYFITAFYDSAIYLAMAYHKTLQEGGDINDGMAVAQKLWNSSFPGKISQAVRMRFLRPLFIDFLIVAQVDLYLPFCATELSMKLIYLVNDY